MKMNSKEERVGPARDFLMQNRNLKNYIYNTYIFIDDKYNI